MKVVAEYKNKGKSKSIEFVVDTTGELIYTSIECIVLMKDTKRAIRHTEQNCYEMFFYFSFNVTVQLSWINLRK